MNTQASLLTGTRGERVALCDVAVSAQLRDLLAEITVSQTYRNDEANNIEAVYTFPLPTEAVLLEVGAEIGGRRLEGAVVEKRIAEGRYEDAIAEGDAAVMLEAIEPGLYTMNVGNLLPGETARLTLRYALLHRWNGDRLRLMLPTTVAPRYGLWRVLPHQVPEVSLTVENRFSLTVEVSGLLAGARFSSPSHPVAFTRAADRAVITLQQPKAVMDRDFVLDVWAPEAAGSFVLSGRDGAGIAAVAGFRPVFPETREPRPLALAIVIDCSGSMAGPSIEQAKRAMGNILDRLRPEDRITVIAFGSHARAFSPTLLPCTGANLDRLNEFAQSLGADMGGTEIGSALRLAYATAGKDESAEVFVITDGEVTDWESIVEEARQSRRRVFTVGVGHAVSEAFVRELAAATGGASELVSPTENMADRIVRHFERLRAPRARRASVQWPAGAAEITPSCLESVFDGDTVVAAARFDRLPLGEAVMLEVETDGGEIVRLYQPMPSPVDGDEEFSLVARIAAAMRLKEADEATGCETALRYRLLSPWTDWLVIAKRPEEERASELPVLRKVPQTLAAGWGGTGADQVFSARQSRLAFRFRSHLDACFMLDITEAADRFTDRLRHLVERIASCPSPVTRADARALLEESGLADEFAEIMAQAALVGVSADTVAPLLLVALIDALPKLWRTDALERAIAPLRQWAAAADAALRRLAARHGDSTEPMRELAASGVLSRPVVALADDQAAVLAALPVRIDETVREIIEEFDRGENRLDVTAEAP